MITTVTTTTVTTMAAMGWTMVVSIIAVVTLLGFLITKEVAGASNSTSAQRTAKFLSAGILPMMMAFAVIVITQIIEILG